MKINIVSRKLIKPCTPTPENLSKYKLSLTDELKPPINYVRVLLFYPSKLGKRSNLEESLAKTLVQFYPLAGRYIKKEHLVDCGDQGAGFVEAEAVDLELIDLLRELKIEQQHDLLPLQVDESATTPLLLIQITEFKCGGLVIGVSVSHRIFDGFSVRTFIAAWSNACSNPEAKITISPSFDFPTLFPGASQVYDRSDVELASRTEIPNIVVKKFSFNKEAITCLRSKLKPNDGSNRVTSRVRVVCALIAKALIGVDQAKCGKSRPFIIAQAVNIRERTKPPLPKHCCGNLAILSYIAATHSKEKGFQELVYLLGDAINKTITDCARILSPGETGRDIVIDPWEDLVERSKSGETNFLMFSDCSKFGFYQVDFGWGKPVLVSIRSLVAENVTMLMDNKEGDGIEAWVQLKPHEMHFFEQDEEIKLLTT